MSYIISDSKLEGKGLISQKNYNSREIIATDLEYISLDIRDALKNPELNYLFSAGLPGEEIPFAGYILLNYENLEWIHHLSPLNKNVKISIPYSEELHIIRRFFSKYDKLRTILTNYDNEQFLNFLLIIKNNYVKRFRASQDDKNIYYQSLLLFRNFSRLNHSCNPNIESDIVYNETTKKWNATLIALSKINIGDELTISYTGLIQNTSEYSKRIQMYNLFGFICKCGKCCNKNKEPSLVYCKYGWNRLMPKRGEEWCHNVQNIIYMILETQGLKITCQKLEDYEKNKETGKFIIDYNLWMEIIYDREAGKYYPRYYRIGSNNNTSNSQI